MTEHQTLTVRLHPNDNVVTARIDLLPNTAVAGEDVACAARIPAGHKVATRPIAKGEPVRKYDQIIGFASADIAPGEHVHMHNVEMQRLRPRLRVRRRRQARPRSCPRTSARASTASCGRAARRARATSSACSRP